MREKGTNMKQIFVVYDDSVMPEDEVKSITGKKTFGETIFKRVSLKNRMKEVIMKNHCVVKFLEFCKEEDFEEICKELRGAGNRCVIVHLYSNFALANN